MLKLLTSVKEGKEEENWFTTHFTDQTFVFAGNRKEKGSIETKG